MQKFFFFFYFMESSEQVIQVYAVGSLIHFLSVCRTWASYTEASGLSQFHTCDSAVLAMNNQEFTHCLLAQCRNESQRHDWRQHLQGTLHSFVTGMFRVIRQVSVLPQRVSHQLAKRQMTLFIRFVKKYFPYFVFGEVNSGLDASVAKNQQADSTCFKT